jgi:hypothetical protein
MNNESILNTTSAINDIIINRCLSVNNKKEVLGTLYHNDVYRFNFTFIKNTSFLEQLLLSDNEKYELTNFVIDHLINYLEKDDSILHNIGHPVCYFLSKMDQNTPVFLELFLNNGLNVDSQFSYNNKQNLYLLDYFSINNLKPDTQIIIRCLDVLKSHNYNFKRYNYNSENHNDDLSNYFDFYIKNNFDIKAILALKDYDINPITEQEKYLILNNYYKDKNIDKEIDTIFELGLHHARLTDSKNTFLTLYINNILKYDHNAFLSNTDPEFILDKDDLSNLEKFINSGIDILSPCKSRSSALSNNYTDTNVLNFLADLNLKDQQLNERIANILYNSSFQSLKNFYKQPDLQNYNNLSDNIIKYRKYLTKEEYSDMILNYTKFCPVSNDVLLSCADTFKDYLLSQKTFRFNILTNYILKYESDNLNNGFIREQYKDLFNKFNMDISQELDHMKNNITVIKDYHILISHWEKHLLSQEINKSNNITSTIKNRL